MRPIFTPVVLHGLRAAAVVVGLALSSPALAATATYSMALDTDANAATGCTIATAAGPLAGIEQVVSTTVDTTTTGATVSRVERQVCAGSVMGAPAAYDAGGWPVGLANGTGGTAVVETAVPLSLLPAGATMRATALSTGGGGQDATATFALALDAVGQPPAGSIAPVPLSPWLVPPLALCVLLLAAWVRRRYPQQAGLFVFVAIFAVSGLVWAATVIRDGLVGDWAGVPAAVTDARADAPPDADLLAVFFQQDSANLYFRFDADVRRVTSNQPPQVSAGSAQTITLPSSASLSGTATDDGLPNPPGALTTTWSKLSGPGTVTFGNANALSTTASFSVAGAYVLRLTASDSALSTTADVTITASDVPTAGPQIAPIADRTIVAGDRLQVAIQATDSAGGALTYSLPIAPSGAALRPAPLIDWVPSLAQVGTHPITARVADGGGQQASTTFNVTVFASANTPPVLSGQANVTISVGTAFTRTLTSVDPDAGDVLTYSLVTGPTGMTLSGATLSWNTSSVSPGTYAVTVRVNDSKGAFDQKSFIVTLQISAAPAPLAVNDAYTVKPGETLALAAPGVLANDENPSGGPLAAQKLTDPAKGTLSAFNADGSFTFVAPASVPAGVSLKASKLWGALLPDSTGYAASADLNHDGGADLVLLSFGTPVGFDGKTGARLWTGWDTSATSLGQYCRMYLFGTDFALGDVDGSGNIALIAGTHCDATYAAGVSNRLISVDTDPAHAVGGAAAVRWVSERLDVQVPLPPAVGQPPVPTYVVNSAQDGLASFATPTLAKLTPTGGVKVLTRIPIVGTQFPYDSDGDGTPDKNAGCMAATGNFADQGKSCTVTFIVNAVTGVKEAVLTAPNPFNQYQTLDWEPMRQTAPVVADLDGDGQVEIISGTDVFKYDGTTWSLAWQSGLPGVIIFYEPTSVSVADLDGDGKAEVILQARWFDASLGGRRGFLTFRHDGALMHRFEPATSNIGLPSIADVDGDGVSELLFTGGGITWAYHADGTLVWAAQVPDDDLASNPDDDPTVAHWPRATYDRSGPGAGLQVYDLDLDGVPEVIVTATHRLVIYDGRTGKLRTSFHNNGFSRNRVVPLIVDANGDGHADILSAAGNSGACAGCPDTNTLAFTGIDRNWAPAPLVQNQVNFNPWAITASGAIVYDGGVHRSFRTQRQLGTAVDPRTRDTTSFTYAAVGNGGTSAPATVTLSIVPQNSPPVITSTPPTALHVVLQGGAYPTFLYQIAATDPDVGDTVRYELVYSSVDTNYFPQATVDPVTGVMRMFTGPCGSYGGPCDFGQMAFIVAAVDSFGARTEQGFVVDVTSQSRTVPAVVGQMVRDARVAVTDVQLVPRVNEVFNAQPVGTVVAQDPLGGTVVARSSTVSLSVSKGPQPVTMPYVVGKPIAAARSDLTALGFAIDVTGQPSSTVAAGTVMAQSPSYGTLVVPTAANPAALTVSTGSPLSAAIASIVVEPGNTTRVVGEDIAYKATAVLADKTARDVTYAAIWASQNTAATVLSAGRVHAAHAGGTNITATMSGVTGTSTLTVVAPSADLVAPIAVISSPADGQSTTGPASVIGTASDANFLRYELAFAADGTDTFTPIAEGSAPVTGGTLGTFDPTVLLNGIYTLQLTVHDRGGNTAVARTSVTVEGNRKVGAFTLAYTDLTVPLPGIPIQIVRTYDSRDKAKGDFGIGWTLGLKAVRVGATRAPGARWQVYKAGLNYELDPGANRYITVTLPNGRVETFDLRVTPSTSPLVPFQTVRASVVTRPGNLGTLEILSNTDLLIVDPQPGPVTLIDDTTLEAFDPDRFRYRQRDGTEFVVTRSRGVESVKDTNGNMITVTPGGISHSAGMAVAFTRDSEDRIVAITDTTGAVRSYTYSGEGDLATATDRTGNTTKWFYDRLHGVVRIEDPLGRVGTRTEYDDTGRIVSITDGNGHITHYAHDIAGRQERIEDPLGRVTVYTYDERGNVTAKSDALGRTSTATFDSRDRMTTSTDALGAVTRFEYDDQDNPTRVVDALGNAISATYDTEGRRLSSTDGRGNPTRFAYDTAGNRTALTDALGHTTTTIHDRAGNPTSITRPDGSVSRVTYDGAGRRTATVDAAGLVVTIANDASGNVTGQSDANGGTASMTYDAERRIIGSSRNGISRSVRYDAAGSIASVTVASGRSMAALTDPTGRLTGIGDPEDGTVLAQSYDAVGNVTMLSDRFGNTTTRTFDAANQLTSATNAAGGTERRTYDAAGRLVEIVDARGARTVYTYDALGRKTSVTDGLGGVTRFEYDANDNLTVETDPRGNATRHDYDVLDRRVRTTYADGATESTEYDAVGRVVRRTNALGGVTQFTYDSLDRVVTVTDPLGGVLRHASWRALGMPSETTDANGHVTRRTYDAAGRPLSVTYPDGTVETRAYDVAGNLVQATNGAGERNAWIYDVRGRPQSVTLADGKVERFTFTPDGLPATTTDARGAVSFSYDPVTRKAMRVTDPGGRYVRYEHDATGLRTLIAHGEGGPERATRYTYDALGRIATATDTEGGVTAHSYDAGGNPTSTTYPGGVTATRTYDVRNRLSGIAYRTPAGVAILDQAFVRDAAGNVLRVTRSDGVRIEYTYDAMSRVTSESRHAGGTLTGAQTFAYDGAGNRLTAGIATPSTYTYSADNRLLSGNGITYDYDQAGRRTAARWMEAGVARTTTYRWDSLDRMIGFRAASGADYTYGYDVDGLRQLKLGPAGDQVYLSDRAHPSGYAQLLASATPSAMDTFEWANGLAGVRENGVAHVPLADSLGSIVAMADATGSVREGLSYDAFGAGLGKTGGLRAIHRHAGEAFDEESGLTYLRARYYDPAAATFLSRDPVPGDLENAASRNGYSYALGNPVNWRDPSGRTTVTEVNFASAQSVALNSKNVLQKRKALQQATEVLVDTARIVGGVMAVEAVMETVAMGPVRVKRWFGSGWVGTMILDIFSAGLGEAVDTGAEIAATFGMSKIAYDMLGGRTVHVGIDGVGVLLAGSVEEAMSAFRAGTRTSQTCSSNPNYLAYADRSNNIIMLCAMALKMPPLPTAETLTRPGLVSLPGLFVHEYSHISLGTKDPAYDCKGSKMAGVIRIPGNALLNADSYRCWAEDSAVGWNVNVVGRM